jgi:hypothetical protein
VLATAGLPAAVLAQGPQGPDLNLLALDWARGRYSAPLMCTFDDEPMRGMRRVLVVPGSPNALPPVGRLVFVELEVDDAGRCFTDFGAPAPNLRGTLQIRLLGAPHPDTARRDFKSAMRREGGFDFYIASGSLQVHTVGERPESAQSIDFAGGEARMRVIKPGTDAFRLLAEFSSPRKVGLRIATRKGVSFSLDMFLSAPR